MPSSKTPQLGSLNINTNVDFLKSASGRIMLTQARAILTGNGANGFNSVPLNLITQDGNIPGNRQEPMSIIGNRKLIKQASGLRSSNSGGSNVHHGRDKGGVGGSSNRRPFSNENESLVGKVTTYKATKGMSETGGLDLLDDDEEEDGVGVVASYHSPVMNKKYGMIQPQYPPTPKYIPELGVESIPEHGTDSIPEDMAAPKQVVYFSEHHNSQICSYIDHNGHGYTK